MEKGWIVYTIILGIILLTTLIAAFIRRKKPQEINKLKSIFADKTELLALIFFIFAMFLLDVNANLISAYGPDLKVHVFGNILVPSTSMFWLGIIVGLISFLIFSIEAISRKKGTLKKIDMFFAIIGGIGLGIILSGGLLVFAGADDLKIQFFKWTIERITYYHIGIAIEALTVLYFALTK